MRLRSLLLVVAVPLLLALSAPSANAGLNSWSGLIGLNAASGSSWVREYATGTPLTIYAATEGGGVYRSVTDGVSWSPMNAGLTGVPGALNVRTVLPSSSGTTVLAGTTAGLFKSVGGGAWQPVAQGPEDDPKHPKKLNKEVQALYSPLVGPLLAGVASGGVYRSYDDGATWIPPSPDNGMSRSESVWGLTSFVGGVIFAATGSGIYRSLDSGATWTLASDGITGTTLRVMKDSKAPNIYYAYGTDGVFRTSNAGITWSNIEGPVGHRMLGGQVRALQQFNGVDLVRLYAATENGVFAGTTDHGPLPGQVTWRKVTNTGLINGSSSNTIFWALTNFTTTPGTLLAGTQSNGGYALTFQPPVNDQSAANRPKVSGTPQVARKLTAMPGSWSGTPTIEFEYQWQRCTNVASPVCTDIPNATDNEYVLSATDQGKKMRVEVEGENDFPTFGLSTANSDYTTAVTANPDDIAGNTSHPSPGVSAPGLPQPGDPISANQPVWFPGATAFTYQWYRCDENGNNCNLIAGAQSKTYTLTDQDVGSKLAATATGTNSDGGMTSDIGAKTNIVLAPDPKQTAPTTLTGNAYVGDTLISGVGGWEYPGTSYARQWELCEADGTSCGTISGAKSASYVLKPGDKGHKLRVRISVDSNGPSNFPAPVEVFSPLSAVVTDPPPPPADPVANGGGGGNPQPQPQSQPNNGGGGGQPGPDTTAPVLQGLTLVAGAIKPGAALQLRSNLTEPGKLAVTLQRAVSGRKVGKTCKAGAKKGKKCTAFKRLASYSLNAPAGAATVSLPKKKLALGQYRLVVTPVDAAGNKGATRTVAFRIKKK
jgi:hypothetical protein